MIKIFRSKIYLAEMLIVLVLVIGVLGYRFISGYTWVDAAYMTVITITTVGFSEVKPLDIGSKIFTIFLIISSVFIVAYAISVITEYILGRNSFQLLKKKIVKNKINDLYNHVIICGYGRNGEQAAKRLSSYKRPFVVIEKDKEIIKKHENAVLFVEGDANDDEILMAARVEKAKYLITAMPKDTTNLFVVLSARQLNKKLFIISRASFVNSQKKLAFAGADKVIMPDKIGGDHMASLVVMPNLISFMDKLSAQGKHTTTLEEIAIEDLQTQTKCNTLIDLDLRKKTGCTIIGYITPNGEYIINPEDDLELKPKSKVIVLGRPKQIIKLNKIFSIT